MRTLECEDASGFVRGAQPDNGGVRRARHDDAEPLGPQERHRIELDGKSLARFVNCLPGFCRPHPSGIDASMSGVEEHRLKAIALRGLESLARSGSECRGAEWRLSR